MNPQKDVVSHFDLASNLFNERHSAFEQIDRLTDILKTVEVEKISGGYFYKCSDTPGPCEYGDEAKVYVSPHQISSIRNDDYEELFNRPIMEILRGLAGAMQYLDVHYPILFKISTVKEIKQYQAFKARIDRIALFINPSIDPEKPAHENAIDYLLGIKGIIEKNLPEVLDTYHHHVETLRESNY